MTVTANIADLTDRPRPALTDQTLLDRFARGDPHAFDDLVAAYQQPISRLVHRLLAWPHDADDVAQEVFLAAFKQIHRFRRQSNIRTWLTAIAIKRCRTHQKKYWVRWRWLRRLMPTENNNAPDQSAIQHETAARVRQAVQQLLPNDREVIVLYYLEQMSVSQMAQLLHASPNAIDVRLHRARQRLKDRLSGFTEE